MLTCNDKFYPVGQGLFYTGTVSFVVKPAKTHEIRFVFDCGSITKSFLRNSVSELHKRLNSSHVDFLVLSHLHEDHANGLENLLRPNLSIGAVFLPYLNPAQRLIVGLRCLRQDAAFFELLANPTGYLIERGVRRVVYLHDGAAHDREEEVPTAPDEPANDDAVGEGIARMVDAERPSGGLADLDPALTRQALHKSVSTSLVLRKIWEFRFFNYDEGSLKRDKNCIDKVIRDVI
jgi:hypothetical protein